MNQVGKCLRVTIRQVIITSSDSPAGHKCYRHRRKQRGHEICESYSVAARCRKQFVNTKPFGMFAVTRRSRHKRVALRGTTFDDVCSWGLSHLWVRNQVIPAAAVAVCARCSWLTVMTGECQLPSEEFTLLDGAKHAVVFVWLALINKSNCAYFRQYDVYSRDLIAGANRVHGGDA